MVVVAGSNPPSSSLPPPLLPQQQLSISSAGNFKRLQFVPARRRDASPPPAPGVPIVRLDVPSQQQPLRANVLEAMAREKSALANNDKHAAAASKHGNDGNGCSNSVAVGSVVAAVKVRKKKAKTSPSNSPRELFPSATLQMRWVEPLKPVRICRSSLFVSFSEGIRRRNLWRKQRCREKKMKTKTGKTLSLSFSPPPLSLSLPKTGRGPPEPR